MGRTAKQPRPAYGAHLAALRVRAGLTQQQLAQAVGVPQSNITFWERSDKPPRGEVLPALAKALGVSVAVVLQQNDGKPRAASAPQGRAGRLFDALTKLPRRQQNRVLDVIEAIVERQAS